MLPKLKVQHSALEITEDQKTNLRTLASHLRGLPTDYDKFDMTYVFLAKPAEGEEHFIPSKDEMVETGVQTNHFAERINECGAVACAIGHGPLAGIPVLDSDNNWEVYAARVFGGSYSDAGTFDFIFSADWTRYANTAADAADRIDYVLAYGFPEYYPDDPDEFKLYEKDWESNW